MKIREESLRFKRLEADDARTTIPASRIEELAETLRQEAKKQKLNFGPDPATHDHCNIGGMLGNYSCGIHSLLAAKHGRWLRTSDNTHALKVPTYRGVRLRVGTTPLGELRRARPASDLQSTIYCF